MPRTIVTDQAPSAKPDAVSLLIGEDWTDLMDGPEYDIPKIGFSSDRRIAPGIVEISSPLVVCNTSEDTVTFSVRITRDNADTDVSFFAWNLPVPAGDSVIVPVQGQFLTSGDILAVQAGVAGALYGTVSYTEGQAEEDDIDV